MSKTGYVTTYRNPDTDGVACALAYEFVRAARGETFRPVFWGALNAEVSWVLEVLSLPSPTLNAEVDTELPVALVDTHHVDQLPPGIRPENVCDIVDHHPVATPERFPNASIQNEIVGAATTLLAEQMLQEGIVPPATLAGVMAAGILSNTYSLRSPSTTARDREALEWLTSLAALPPRFADELASRIGAFGDTPTLELLEANAKVFTLEGVPVLLVQLEVQDSLAIIERPDLLTSLDAVKLTTSARRALLTVVDLQAELTRLMSSDTSLLQGVAQELNAATSTGAWMTANGLLMRKTHIVQAVTRVLQSEGDQL